MSRWMLVLLLAVLVGCGSKRPPASASGTVKYAGEAVATGSIRFDPVDVNDARTIGSQIKDGTYEIPRSAGLVEGQYVVAIFGTRETGKTVAPAETLNNTPATPMKEVEQYIPEKYNAETTLKVTLKAGENTNQNFDLETGVKPRVSTPSAPRGR